MRSIKAVFAVTGGLEELKDFERELKSRGIEGVMSNETARIIGVKWIVVYLDFDEKNKEDRKPFYAYRDTNCKRTSKPRVISLKTALKRLQNNVYFETTKNPVV